MEKNEPLIEEIFHIGANWFSVMHCRKRPSELMDVCKIYTCDIKIEIRTFTIIVKFLFILWFDRCNVVQ